MSEFTPILGLQELDSAQAQPEVVINGDLRALECLIQLNVISKTTTSPPGSPADGARYLVPATGATGAWAGLGDHVVYASGGWKSFMPEDGWLCWVKDQQQLYKYTVGSPSAWEVFASGGGGGGGEAEDIFYNHATSGLESSDVQAAIDELASRPSGGGGSGGGASAGQEFLSSLTVDVPYAVPGDLDDEFDGATLDAKWTWFNQGSATADLAGGSLKLTDTGSPNSIRLLGQTISGSAWRYRAKMWGVPDGTTYFGIGLYDSVGAAVLIPGVLDNPGPTPYLWMPYKNGLVAGTISTYAVLTDVTDWDIYDGGQDQFKPYYYEVELASATIHFRVSRTGDDGSFAEIGTVTLTTAGFANPIDTIGLAFNASGPSANIWCAWFRDVTNTSGPALVPATNLTQDTHPISPTSYDEEFESGDNLVWVNQGLATATIVDGCLVLLGPASLTTNHRVLKKTAPSGTWKFRAKIMDFIAATANDFSIGGLWVRNSGTGKITTLHKAFNGGGYKLEAINWTDINTFSAGLAGPTDIFTAALGRSSHAPLYLEIENNGTTIFLRYSDSGVDGTYLDFTSQTLVTFMTAIDEIGLFVNNDSGLNAPMLITQYLRRIA